MVSYSEQSILSKIFSSCDSKPFFTRLQQSGVLVRFSRRREEKPRRAFHRMEEESGALCIIDEALYRQTKLNTEKLAALPPRMEVVGGRVGEGAQRDVQFSRLTYCICTEQGRDKKDSYTTPSGNKADVVGKTATLRLGENFTWPGM